MRNLTKTAMLVRLFAVSELHVRSHTLYLLCFTWYVLTNLYSPVAAGWRILCSYEGGAMQFVVFQRFLHLWTNRCSPLPAPVDDVI